MLNVPSQIDVHHQVVVLQRDVHQLVGLADPGIVDQDVDLAEIGEDRGVTAWHCRGIGDVAAIAAMRWPDYPRPPLGLRGIVEIDNRDQRAMLGKALRRRLADTALRGGTGDDRNLAQEQDIARAFPRGADGGGIGHIAAAVAADADVGLLGMAGKSLQHAEPRAALRRSWPMPRRSGPADRCRSSGTCRPRARRCSAPPSSSAACGWCPITLSPKATLVRGPRNSAP